MVVMFASLDGHWDNYIAMATLSRTRVRYYILTMMFGNVIIAFGHWVQMMCIVHGVPLLANGEQSSYDANSPGLQPETRKSRAFLPLVVPL